MSSLSQNAFAAKYQKWCSKNGYHFSAGKAEEIHAYARKQVGALPKSEGTKVLVKQAVQQLKEISSSVASLKKQMSELAATLPEYPIVMQMYGVGPALGPQLMADIGDVRRFHSKKALVAFAGIDAPSDQSGQWDSNSCKISGHPLFGERCSL